MVRRGLGRKIPREVDLMGYVEIIPLDQCDQCDSCQAIKPKNELWVISATGLDLMYECDKCFRGK